MESSVFAREQFITLRAEIKSIKAHLFWTVILGLFGVPALTILAVGSAGLALLFIPFSVLMLIVLYLVEQNQMMRAGRFIREQIESESESSPGWERWLESRGEFRVMERHFTACFIVIFFVYYFTSIGIAIQRLWDEAANDPAGLANYWLYGFGVMYVIGAIWAFSTLVHHWRATVSTA